MDILKSINDNLLVLIPVMYILGLIFKDIKIVKNKYIPLILLPIGIAFSIVMNGFYVNSVIQGILITGATVYTNQVIKQCCKKE